MKNAVATKQPSFSTALTEHLDSVGTALPSGFNKQRFVTNALALLNDSPDLQKYGAPQIISGLTKGAVLGLDFFNKEAYLVPYGSKLNYQTSYTGSVKLAKKYAIRPIKEIYAKLVREGDVFEESIEHGEQTFSFKPMPFNANPIIGAFAVCQFADGGIQYDTMSLTELETTRKHSKASNSPAWKDFTGEMYKKTVLRRLCKHIEIDFESIDQRSVFDEEMAIETDPKEIAAQDIAENANKEEFVDIIEADGKVTEVATEPAEPLDSNGNPIFK